MNNTCNCKIGTYTKEKVRARAKLAASDGKSTQNIKSRRVKAQNFVGKKLWRQFVMGVFNIGNR